MANITYHQKKKRINQLEGWIESINNRLYRLNNIHAIVKKEKEEIDKNLVQHKISVLSMYKELNIKKTIPTLINNLPFEQSDFKTIEEATDYLFNILEKSYDEFQFGNSVIYSLYEKTHLEIEALTNYTPEIKSLKIKLDKHNKNLNKIQRLTTKSTKSIENSFKIKSEHVILLDSIQNKIDNKYSILKHHLYKIEDMKRYLIELENPDKVKKEYIHEGFFDEESFFLYLNRIDNSSSKKYFIQVKKWISNNIKEIRKLKSKQKRLKKDYEEYLLEAGSSGEKEIRYFLLNKNINFEEQKRFKTCVDKKMLPFDFYIKEINMLIEFDGAQHYMPIDLFGGEEGFTDRKRKDKIKTNWAKEEKINLIRIRYDDNLNEKLDDINSLIIKSYL